MNNPSAVSTARAEVAEPGRASAGARPQLKIVTKLLTILSLTALGCAAPFVSEAADTCEMRFQGEPWKVVTYSRVAESGDYTVRIDVCRGPGYEKGQYDPEAIPLQTDEYAWDGSAERWTLIESPRIQAGPCASFTEGLNIGTVAAIEQLLCSESVPPEEEFKIFKVTLHSSKYGCWRCYDPDKTIWKGSFAQEVYCQSPDYHSGNKRVHLDAYLYGSQFQAHLGTYMCPNVDGLTPSEVDFLCGNKHSQRPTCGN